MKLSLKALSILIYVLVLSRPAWALRVITPQMGEKIPAGSDLTVIVKPDPGEEWEAVALGFDAMDFNAATQEYRRTIKIPSDLLGLSDFPIIGRDKAGNEIEITVNVIVILPSTVKLKNLKADPKEMFLRKLPPGSDPNQVRFAETERIAVMGIFSDGIEREVSSSSLGATYQTSDPKIATVDTEGLVTAVAPGKAVITVKNGDKQLQVQVNVSAK